jgi:O-methyltransferase involved in polyketide biosynthesis
MTNANEISFKDVGLTAQMVAYGRIFTDIPYSQEIFNLIELSKDKEIEDAEKLAKPELLPQYEARYKLINQLVLQHKVKQVFEIASGYSPRGLEFTDDPDFKYVEFEQPNMVEEKQEIVNAIKKDKNLGSRSNLILEAGNALNFDDLKKASLHLDLNYPLAIIVEGLLRYFDFDEKTILANYIYELLNNFGGIWITSDTLSFEDLKGLDNAKEKQNEQISKAINIDTEKNFFQDQNHAQSFFEQLGFTVERHAYSEVFNQLVSPLKLNLSLSVENNALDTRFVFLMKPKIKL